MTEDRRTFLKRSALSVPLLTLPAFARSEQAAVFPGMIVRMAEPQNLEYPFSQLDGPITPAEHFFVRSHFAVPKIDLKAWRLKVEGAVKQPLELTYDDVLKLASSTLTSTMECAGNGRVFLVPQPAGVQWGLGAVSTAKWKGVALSAILDKAGVKDGAVEVILEGADRGTVANPPSPGPISFARSLPLKKALQPETLLAYQMNDADLTPAHGQSLRAVVGGWYGMASVKWLNRIVVTDREYRGYWQSLDYTVFERRDGLPTSVPIAKMEVKSSIARPARGEVVAGGKPYRVFGAAWSGEASIARVEVSADGGKTWKPARFPDQQRSPWAWTLWEYDWLVPGTRGPVQLMARATDTAGRTQPLDRDPDKRHYMVSHVVPVEVLVK